MTRDEFEAAYAERSRVPVEYLHYLGRHAEPCSCGGEGCEGWVMGRQHEDALMEDICRDQGRGG